MRRVEATMTRNRASILFSSGLWLSVGVLLALTRSLGPVSGWVPLRVIMLTLALLSFQLAREVVPGLSKRLSEVERNGRADDEWARLWNALWWILALLVSIALLGFLTGAPLFTALYLKFRAKESWRTSLGVAAAVSAVCFGVFATLLGARLYEGLLWKWL